MNSDLRLAAGPWSLALSPERGGALVNAVWDGRPITRVLDAATAADGPAGRLGCFAMLPWCNRIDRGRFAWGGAEVAVPVNRPETDVAVHGFGRERPWTVIAATEHLAAFRQDFAEPGNPFAYRADQSWRIDEVWVEATLTVTNRGALPLPFGLGFHPYFHRTPLSRVRFAATGEVTLDDRALPDWWRPSAGLDQATADLAGLDRPYSGWDGTASLTWPEERLRLTLTASPSLGVLHAYAPAGEPFVCLEPVSHLPNVQRRRDLAPHGDLTVLAPGESLSGWMRWTVERM